MCSFEINLLQPFDGTGCMQDPKIDLNAAAAAVKVSRNNTEAFDNLERATPDRAPSC